MVEATPIAVPMLFDVGGLQLFAKRYGTRGGRPVLALHGWLDNCASFELLAPLLAECDLVCLDCAGHGKSGHRAHLGAYNIWQDVAELFCVADQLGWRQFTLLGHSRGAMSTFLAAGTLPDRVSNLILIEGVYPAPGAEEDAPAILAKSVETLLTASERPRRFYKTFDQVVRARANGFIPVSIEDAQLLAQHGTIESIDGFQWMYDYKLTIGSEVRLTTQQVKAFQHNIKADTVIILAEDGLLANDADVKAMLQTFHQASIVVLPGGHHLHMSSHCRLVAATIRDYLQ